MKSVIVSSLKGGLGKSFTSLNIARALAKKGLKVGLFDCDIDSSNQAELLCVDEVKIKVTPDEKFDLYKQDGIQFFSMSLMTAKTQGVSMNSDRYVQFIADVLAAGNWDVDYLVFDLPAGAGDIFRGVVVLLHDTLAGGVIVSTPFAKVDLTRLISLHEHFGIQVFGVIENFAYFQCEHKKKYYLFGKSAIKNIIEPKGIGYLGQIPLTMEVREKLDKGQPPYVENEIFTNLAEAIVKVTIDKPGFLQRVKDRIVKIAKNELEQVLADMIVSFNRNFDIGGIQQKYQFTKAKPFDLVLMNDEGDVLSATTFQIKDGKLKVVEGVEGTRQIVTDISTLSRVILGERKIDGKVYKYTPVDAVFKGDIMLYGTGSTQELMKIMNGLFSGEVMEQIRERYKRVLNFLAGEA